jgi:hypothetical protein
MFFNDDDYDENQMSLSDADRLSRLETKMAGVVVQSDSERRRVDELVGSLRTLAEAQRADIGKIGNEMHTIRIELTKLSQRVLAYAALLAPVVVVLLNSLARKWLG